MQCKIFEGSWNQVQDMFNRWAKDNAITREIIIHTTAVAVYKAQDYHIHVIIAVYYPDISSWAVEPQ